MSVASLALMNLVTAVVFDAATRRTKERIRPSSRKNIMVTH